LAEDLLDYPERALVVGHKIAKRIGWIKMADEFNRIVLGLCFLGVIIFFIAIYIIWNLLVRRKEIRFIPIEDDKLINQQTISEEELVEKIREMVGPLISANSAFAAITVAALFIVLALVFTGEVDFGPGRVGIAKQNIMYAVLALTSISAIFWITILPMLIGMKEPSTTPRIIFRFRKYTALLNNLAIYLLTIAIYLFLLLGHAYVAMAAGFVTLLCMLRFFRIWHEW
jgi:hypothetical protein